jgi:large subunit ribosomal protein L30
VEEGLKSRLPHKTRKKTMTPTKKKTASKSEKNSSMLKIKWVVSFIGCPRGMRQTIRGLGFRRMQQVVERPDTPSIRGMIAKVHHLVRIEE